MGEIFIVRRAICGWRKRVALGERRERLGVGRWLAELRRRGLWLTNVLSLKVWCERYRVAILRLAALDLSRWRIAASDLRLAAGRLNDGARGFQSGVDLRLANLGRRVADGRKFASLAWANGVLKVWHERYRVAILRLAALDLSRGRIVAALKGGIGRDLCARLAIESWRRLAKVWRLALSERQERLGVGLGLAKLRRLGLRLISALSVSVRRIAILRLAVLAKLKRRGRIGVSLTSWLACGLLHEAEFKCAWL